jgi:hypothetical protein
VCYLSNQSTNFDCENNIDEAARAYCDNLLPVSRERYEKVFREFEAWCNKKKVKTITEEVGASVHRRVEVYISGGGIHRKFHSE